MIRQRWRGADATGSRLDVLRLEGGDDVVRRQGEIRHAVAIEPHPHAVVGRGQQRHVADAADALERIDDVDGRVVAQKKLIVAAVRRRQGNDLQDRRRLLLDLDALRANFRWKLRLGEPNPVLHQHVVDVGIGADREGDAEGVAAVVAAGRFHVEHLVDADDAGLDRLRHDGFDDFCARARIGRRHLTCGGTMFGNWAIGIAVSAISPASVMTTEMTTASRGRSMKTLDSMAHAPDLTSVACTTCPGRTFCMPSVMTFSPALRPLVTTTGRPVPDRPRSAAPRPCCRHRRPAQRRPD